MGRGDAIKHYEQYLQYEISHISFLKELTTPLVIIKRGKNFLSDRRFRHFADIITDHGCRTVIVNCTLLASHLLKQEAVTIGCSDTFNMIFYIIVQISNIK